MKYIIKLALFFLIVFLDIAGLFSYSDVPFVVILLFISWNSRRIFMLAMCLLIWMFLSYLPTGSGPVTERISTWFYLLFVLGLLTTRTWGERRGAGKQTTHVDWNSYYMHRMGNEKLDTVRKQLQDHRRWYINWMDYIDARVPIYKRSIRVFEIGSGMGGILTLLEEHKVQAVGSDISKKAQKVFHLIFPHTKFVICDIERLVPPGGPYDRILAFEVLEHVKHLDRAVTHIKKALTPGGYFIGTTPYPYPHTVHAPTHINVHHPLYWKQLFIKNGFSQVSTYSMSLPPYLWRIHPKLNVVLPFYVPFVHWISTTLIIARL